MHNDQSFTPINNQILAKMSEQLIRTASNCGTDLNYRRKFLNLVEAFCTMQVPEIHRNLIRDIVVYAVAASDQRASQPLAPPTTLDWPDIIDGGGPNGR